MAGIVDLRRQLFWTQRELAKRARLDPNTVRKAEQGEPVSPQSAFAIADAFGKALGREIHPREIDGLNVSL